MNISPINPTIQLKHNICNAPESLSITQRLSPPLAGPADESELDDESSDEDDEDDESSDPAAAQNFDMIN